MNLNVLKAKIKRNNLVEYAGKYYRDNNSQIVNSFNKERKKALLGIEREDGVYTILGENSVYYSTKSGFKGETSLKSFSDSLHTYAMKKGKRAQYEFLETDDNKAIWLNDKLTMNALWNVVLWLENLQEID